MKLFFTIFKKEITELTRSKKILILSILFLFIAVSSPIIAKLIPTLLKSIPSTPGLIITLPTPTWNDALDQFVKNISQIAMIVIIFVFAGSIAEEKNKKTLEMVLTKPIPRNIFVLAKITSSFFVTKIIFLVTAAIFYFYTVSTFTSFSLINFFWLCIFTLAFLLLIEAITVFFSTITNNQITAVGFAFLTEIIFSTLIAYFKKIADYSPTYVFGHYKELMANGVLTHFWPPLIVTIGLICVLILVSMHFFQKQEIER